MRGGVAGAAAETSAAGSAHEHAVPGHGEPGSTSFETHATHTEPAFEPADHAGHMGHGGHAGAHGGHAGRADHVGHASRAGHTGHAKDMRRVAAHAGRHAPEAPPSDEGASWREPCPCGCDRAPGRDAPGHRLDPGLLLARVPAPGAFEPFVPAAPAPAVPTVFPDGPEPIPLLV